MGSLFTHVVILCVLVLVLLGVTVWSFAIFRQAYSCRNDPVIRCAQYSCPDGDQGSEERFGIGSALANMCKDGNCECAWIEGANGCMQQWCRSNFEVDGVWRPITKCTKY